MSVIVISGKGDKKGRERRLEVHNGQQRYEGRVRVLALR